MENSECRKLFNKIYSVRQCLDINDIDIAITELRKLAAGMGHYWTAEMRKRYAALTQKKQDC